MFMSGDGGCTWSDVFGSWLKDVGFCCYRLVAVNYQTCWMLDSSDVENNIALTSDCGHTWTSRSTATGWSPIDLGYVNLVRGWLIQQYGSLMSENTAKAILAETSSGGDIWAPVTPAFRGDVQRLWVRAGSVWLDELVEDDIKKETVLHRATAPRYEWEEVLRTRSAVSALEQLPSKRVLVAGEGGFAVELVGDACRPLQLPVGADIVASAVHSSTCLLLTAEGDALVSEDSGVNWQVARKAVPGEIIGCALVSPLEGVLGTTDTIYRFHL